MHLDVSQSDIFLHPAAQRSEEITLTINADAFLQLLSIWIQLQQFVPITQIPSESCLKDIRFA